MDMLSTKSSSNNCFAANTLNIVMTLVMLITLCIGVYMIYGFGKDVAQDYNKKNMHESSVNTAQSLTQAKPTPQKQVPKSKWVYENYTNEMYDNVIHYAYLDSDGKIELTDERAIYMQLMIKYSENMGLQAAVIIPPCATFQQLEITIRVDSDKPITLKCHRPTDGDLSFIWIDEKVDELVTRLKTSQRLLVSPTIYGNGSPIFKFDTSGLKWNIEQF